jgi:hypothetical protein
MTTRRVTYADISARRTFQGAWELSAVIDGYWVDRQYMGYTKREALRMFHALINSEELR